MAKTPKRLELSYLDRLDKNFLKEQHMTASASAPGAGEFYSEITGRAKMIDLSKDLGVRFGVERIMIQGPMLINNELGPGGKKVYKVPNDKFDQIRLVGNWIESKDNRGIRFATQTLDDFMEVTFYGTGLNLISHNFTDQDFDVYVDGSFNNSVTKTSASDVLGARNYGMNCVFPAVSGLPLGIHTVKIVNVDPFNAHYGIEILNERTDLLVTQGEYFVDGKLLRNQADQSISYSSDFENEYGTAGTKGGHVAVYIDENGFIKKDIQWNDVSAQYLTSTDHSNEQVIAKHNWREFGAGRGDDFSTLSTASTDRAFTLDDGTTTLVCDDCSCQISIAAKQALLHSNIGDSWTLTFVGTGLDIIRRDNNDAVSAQNNEVFIDGVSVGSASSNASSTERVEKICSGLPYGTHTVKIIMQDSASYSYGVKEFVVYGPKKPEVPSSAQELASYFLMADFDSSTATSNTSIGMSLEYATGVIAKMNTREFIYEGTPTLTSLNKNYRSGFRLDIDSTNDIQKYTFFGTGFQLRASQTGAGASTVELRIDGVANNSGSVVFGGTNNGDGTYTKLQSNDLRVDFTGLPLGVHTLEIQGSSGVAWFTDGIDIITPVHSPKLNGPYFWNNTLRVGSCTLSDSRKLNKEEATTIVNTAPNSTSSFTITEQGAYGTSILDLASAIDIKGDNSYLEVTIDLQAGGSNANQSGIALFIDGNLWVQNNTDATTWSYTFTNPDAKSISARIPISKGNHFVQVFADAPSGGTLTVGNRNISLKEIK